MKRPALTKLERRACTACGGTFVARPSSHGRLPKTCSTRCQITALDRMIRALEARRDALVQRLTTGGAA